MCIFIIINDAGMVEQYFYYSTIIEQMTENQHSYVLLIKILTIVNSYTYNKTIVHPHIDIMANVFKPYQPKPAKKNETKIANHVRSCFQLLSIIQGC